LVEDVIATYANGDLTTVLQDALSKMFYNQTHRRPMVFAIVREV